MMDDVCHSILCVLCATHNVIIVQIASVKNNYEPEYFPDPRYIKQLQILRESAADMFTLYF